MAKIKTLIKFILYYFITISNEIKPNYLLLIRLDAIGDYVFFRNFIELLKKSKKYNITLIGNSVWKNLAVGLDGEFIDSFIWFDRNRFNKDLV